MRRVGSRTKEGRCWPSGLSVGQRARGSMAGPRVSNAGQRAMRLRAGRRTLLGHVRISRVVLAAGSAPGFQLRATTLPSAVRRHGDVVLISCARGRGGQAKKKNAESVSGRVCALSRDATYPGVFSPVRGLHDDVVAGRTPALRERLQGQAEHLLPIENKSKARMIRNIADREGPQGLRHLRRLRRSSRRSRACHGHARNDMRHG